MNTIFVVTNNGCFGVGCCVEIVGIFDDRQSMLAAFPEHEEMKYLLEPFKIRVSGGQLEPKVQGETYYYEEYVRNTHVD